MLLHQIETHLRMTQTPAARFGRDAVGDPRFVFDLRSGREPRSRTVRRVLAYIEQRASESARAANTPEPLAQPCACPCSRCPYRRVGM